MDNIKSEKACCFFGHRKINKTEELKRELYKTISDLIEKEKVDSFLFGSKSEFDALCLKVVTELKEIYTHIKRIYVRSAFPDISDSYEKYLLESYDETCFPEKIRNAGKAAYAERNQKMIDNSKFCIVYYNKDYIPPKRKSGKGEFTDYQPNSGTAIAYKYAVKKERLIKNLYFIER